MRLTRRAHLLAGLALGLAAAHLAGAIALQDPYTRAAIALVVVAVVMSVWGVRCCLADHARSELAAAMDRHPAGSRG